MIAEASKSQLAEFAATMMSTVAMWVISEFLEPVAYRSISRPQAAVSPAIDAETTGNVRFGGKMVLFTPTSEALSRVVMNLSIAREPVMNTTSANTPPLFTHWALNVPKPGTDSKFLKVLFVGAMVNPNERDWPPPWTNWPAASPLSRLALRLATRPGELTLNGALPLPTVRLSAGPVPLLVTESIECLAEPVMLDVAFTLLVLPRLKT